VKVSGIKGMNDILPEEIAIWHFLEDCVKEVFHAFGFREIRVPVLEKTNLFSRSIGEETDIVEKEMYTFFDKSDNSLTLRPEGTASVVRSFIEHNLHNLQQLNKLYYVGPMFRYERPQKGRYRQFHQIGAEVIGENNPLVDAQLLVMLVHFFQRIGIQDAQLQVNSLGCPECRPLYREALVAFLGQKLDSLCSDCRRRYRTNPLRVLDCKVEKCKEACNDAPSVLDYLCGHCSEHFTEVQKHLQNLGVPFEINSRMVRGLDYYTKTTFEMITGSLGSQNALAAGGRYDGLIKSLGGPSLPAIGFAIGMERLVLMKGKDSIPSPGPDIFLAAMGDQPIEKSFLLMSGLQKNNVHAEMDFSNKSLKAQLRRADKLNARYVLILGEDELAVNQALLKNMEQGTQEKVSLENLQHHLVDLLK
jgi:histidyl-tRNA synthetase